MGNLFWEDSTSAYGLQAGMYGYAGYFNGPFANESSIRHRFPGKPVMGYATRMSGHGADAIDCEPGTISGSFSGNAYGALVWVRAWTGGEGIFNKPVVYCMASWVRMMEDFLASHGIPRSRYYMNSSHATGVAHYCGPNTCGYGRTQADMTQYKFASSYDRTIMQSYVLKGHGPAPAPVPAPPQKKIPSLGSAHASDRGVSLAWSAVPGAREYDVQLTAGGKEAGRIKTAMSHTAFAVKPSTDYEWRVAALPGDGWSALAKFRTPAAPVPAVAKDKIGDVLRLNDHGTAVLRVQQRLYNLHYHTAVFDGVYGTDTEAKVKMFQAFRHLTPDGVVGPATWAQLELSPAPELAKPVPQPVPVGPAAPGSLKVTSAGYTSFKASWTAPVGGTQYRVYVYKGLAKAANLVASYPRLGKSGGQYGGLKRNTAYILHVAAENKDGISRPYTYAEVGFKTS